MRVDAGGGGRVEVSAGGTKLTLKKDGDVTVQTDGNLSLKGTNVTVEASGKLKLSGAVVEVN